MSESQSIVIRLSTWLTGWCQERSDTTELRSGNGWAGYILFTLLYGGLVCLGALTPLGRHHLQVELWVLVFWVPTLLGAALLSRSGLSVPSVWWLNIATTSFSFGFLSLLIARVGWPWAVFPAVIHVLAARKLGPVFRVTSRVPFLPIGMCILGGLSLIVSRSNENLLLGGLVLGISTTGMVFLGTQREIEESAREEKRRAEEREAQQRRIYRDAIEAQMAARPQASANVESSDALRNRTAELMESAQHWVSAWDLLKFRLQAPPSESRREEIERYARDVDKFASDHVEGLKALQERGWKGGPAMESRIALKGVLEQAIREAKNKAAWTYFELKECADVEVHFTQDVSALLMTLNAVLLNASEGNGVEAADEVWISATRAVDRRFVQIVVEDNGPGFPRESDPMDWVRPFHGSKQNTNGLGLTTVEGLVSASGGRLILKNRLNLKGASVTLMLLVAQEEKKAK